MLKQFPNGLVACVSDSYDIFNAIKIWGTDHKETIMNRDGTLVIRPDSGDPPTIDLQILQELEKYFPVKINDKGYKVLDNHIRIIQGDGIDLDIKEGDTVYCHHFLVEDENEVKFYKQELVYKIHWSDVYCRERNGKLKMLHYWNFVEQKMENEEDFKTESGLITKPYMEEVKLHGYIRHMNDWMKKQGIKEGDEVIFSENSEYDMNIMGKKLMRMRNFDILAKIEK